ncbi:MAG TPA: hypothetical protein VFP05_13195 [Thermomicrobiales bacterium]|nr:hypothetical protein [Thermomicrobiales bacterium]
MRNTANQAVIERLAKKFGQFSKQVSLEALAAARRSFLRQDDRRGRIASTVLPVALLLFVSCVLPLQAMGFGVRAESAELPSNWTVEAYGDNTQNIIPRAINNNGVAVAQLQTAAGYFPVQLSGGQIVTLGDGATQGFPAAINDDGEIVGTNFNPDGGTVAVTYAPGAYTELNSGAAWDIDSSGTIVGSVNNVPAYWPNGEAPLALPALIEGQVAQVFAINANGWMVGDAVGPHWASGDLLADHAVLWRDGQIIDLGSVVPGLTIAIDVNDAGTIIGETIVATDDTTEQSNKNYASFTWQDGTLSPLPFADGDTSCEVYAINNLGWIAGDCGVGQEQHAVLWVDGEIVEVDTLLGEGWKSIVATGVNDNGQITGQGFLNGVVVAFVLTPDE